MASELLRRYCRRSSITHRLRENRSMTITSLDSTGIYPLNNVVRDTARWMEEFGLDEEFFCAIHPFVIQVLAEKSKGANVDE